MSNKSNAVIVYSDASLYESDVYFSTDPLLVTQ